MSSQLSSSEIAWFRSLSKSQQDTILSELSDEDLDIFRNTDDLFLNESQIVEGDQWRTWFIQAGRGFGKTYAGACWVKKQVYRGVRSIGLVGPTTRDINNDMVKLLISLFPEDDKPQYNQNSQIITFHTGATARVYSSEIEIRGANFEKVWCDEMAKWCSNVPETIEERYKILQFAVRIGKSCQTLITSTPKPYKIFRQFKEDNLADPENHVLVTGSTLDNLHLSARVRKELQESYDGTTMGRQELYGELIEDIGSLFSFTDIDKNRVEVDPMKLRREKITKVVVAVDPAVSTNADSDLTGIIVAGLGSDGHAYILEDASGKYSPLDWAEKAFSLYTKYGACKYVVEKNQGGNLVAMNIRQVHRGAVITEIHAKVGKKTRAEPVAARYQKGRVHHVGVLSKLENQMIEWVPEVSKKSPDRLDALVYAVTDLLLTAKYTYRNFSNLPML